jgi:molybdopterin synthase sulfur carrier subunit
VSVIVRIPIALRKITADQDSVSADGNSILECVESLEASYPGLKERLCDEAGEIRRFVNVYVNGEDVRFLQGLTTPLKDGDEVSIVPAVAGGWGWTCP